MNGFAALMMTALVAAASPAVRDAVRVSDAAEPVGEAYVAELDADWNVTREVRVACPMAAGCAVDLGLAGADLSAVHVRFDPLRAGAVGVTSRLEDQAGRASPARGATLALDRTGFGASHYEASMTASGADGRIILMAVKVPGWIAPAALGGAPRADRT